MCVESKCVVETGFMHLSWLATEKVHGAPKASAAKETRGHAPGNAIKYNGLEKCRFPSNNLIN